MTDEDRDCIEKLALLDPNYLTEMDRHRAQEAMARVLLKLFDEREEKANGIEKPERRFP